MRYVKNDLPLEGAAGAGAGTPGSAGVEQRHKDSKAGRFTARFRERGQ
jgi:hypothetical protein